MKQLTFHGKGTLVVPGHTLAAGESAEISDKVADEITRGNRGLPITITDLPAKSGRKRRATSAEPKRRAAGATSQPEAREGEGQPPASTDQEE